MNMQFLSRFSVIVDLIIIKQHYSFVVIAKSVLRTVNSYATGQSAQHNNLVQPFYNLYRVQEKCVGGGQCPPSSPPPTPMLLILLLSALHP